MLDDKHPILEAIGADEQADYLKELLEDTDFSQDEIEKRYWLNTYKAVAVMRNETEGLRRKRVNEITRVQRRPLKVIENSLDTISGKMRSKMGEVNHVKSRVEQEIARRQRVAAAAKPDPGSNAAGPADPDAMDVDEPLDRPGPSAPAPPNNDSIMCSICFEEIEEPTVTPCAHEFCLDVSCYLRRKSKNRRLTRLKPPVHQRSYRSEPALSALQDEAELQRFEGRSAQEGRGRGGDGRGAGD